MFGRSVGEMASEETEPRPITVPSAGDRAMAVMPILPPAPARFSTTKDWPAISPSLAQTSRTSVSTPPPGAKGVMKRTVWFGQAPCAIETPGIATVAIRLRREMNMDLFLPRQRLCGAGHERVTRRGGTGKRALYRGALLGTGEGITKSRSRAPQSAVRTGSATGTVRPCATGRKGPTRSSSSVATMARTTSARPSRA